MAVVRLASIAASRVIPHPKHAGPAYSAEAGSWLQELAAGGCQEPASRSSDYAFTCIRRNNANLKRKLSAHSNFGLNQCSFLACDKAHTRVQCETVQCFRSIWDQTIGRLF